MRQLNSHPPPSKATDPRINRFQDSGLRSVAKALGFALLIAAFLTQASAGQPPREFKLSHEEHSIGGSFVAEHYVRDSNEVRRIWIAAGENSTNRAFLFEHGRSATVLFSPDEKWLVVNNYEGSTDASPILFRQKRGVRYEPFKGIDLSAIVWKAAAADQGFPGKTDFDHRYSEVVCWLGPHTVLLRAWGHHSGDHGNHSLKDWFCLYDIRQRKIFFDLKLLSKGAFQQSPRATSRKKQ